MVLSSYHHTLPTPGLQQHRHHQHRWSYPCSTPSHNLSTRDRAPATPLLRISRQQFFVARADSKRRTGPGDTESKEVLDAFFLGKAFAEAVTERLGTVVGELLSDVGRWQAEQQKQVQGFQEEVQERAKKARAKALQEAPSVERKEVTSVSQNGASSPARADDSAQTVVPLKRPNAPQDSTSS